MVFNINFKINKHIWNMMGGVYNPSASVSAGMYCFFRFLQTTDMLNLDAWDVTTCSLSPNTVENIVTFC